MTHGSLLVFVADLHVGHPFAVCPAEWTLHDGQVYRPNPLQKLIRAHWCATWQRVGEQRKGRRLIICVAGDATEGLHHNTTQVITGRTDTQEAMAAAVLEEALHLSKFNLRRGDTLRLITGTPAHDGNGAASLERIARSVLDYHGDQRQTRDYWQAEVHGVRFDVAHRPGSGPGTRNWVRGNAFQAWLKSLYLNALEAQQPPPRYVIRAHRHDYLRRDVYNLNGEIATTGIILAAWKGKDEYVYQLAPEAIASIGALTVTVEPDGTTWAECQRIEIPQDHVETL